MAGWRVGGLICCVHCRLTSVAACDGKNGDRIDGLSEPSSSIETSIVHPKWLSCCGLNACWYHDTGLAGCVGRSGAHVPQARRTATGTAYSGCRPARRSHRRLELPSWWLLSEHLWSCELECCELEVRSRGLSLRGRRGRRRRRRRSAFTATTGSGAAIESLRKSQFFKKFLFANRKI